MALRQYPCPRCGRPIRISSRTDWESLVTYWYPLCPGCNLSTKEVYPTPEAAREAARKLSETRKETKPDG